MKVTYHRLVGSEVREILAHYENEVGHGLANRFFDDLSKTLAKASSNPQHFPPCGTVLRRANLTDFPYYFLYEERLWGIKVMVVRHHRRDPRYGMRRR